MGLSLVRGVKITFINRDGFTFLTAIFMVMIIGIMLGLTGQSWKMIMKREREKELLFRGSQIKEAIENWNNPKYTVDGVKWNAGHPLMELKDLLKNPYTLTPLRYLPHSYAMELDDRNPKCGNDCPKLKIEQDPMTGKKWTIIRGTISADPNVPGGTAVPGVQNAQGMGIIGVASKSDEEPMKKDFKDTALENMAPSAVGAVLGAVTNVNTSTGAAATSLPSNAGRKMTKYSEWEFKAEAPTKNDHSKIYRAYHEGW
jgi:Tfp pilus assembly protein PilE